MRAHTSTCALCGPWEQRRATACTAQSETEPQQAGFASLMSPFLFRDISSDMKQWSLPDHQCVDVAFINFSVSEVDPVPCRLYQTGRCPRAALQTSAGPSYRTSTGLGQNSCVN